jgi:hypothetical protein
METKDQKTMIQKILKKYLKGIAICTINGDVLYKQNFGNPFSSEFIRNLVATLKSLGTERIGLIKKIVIQGLKLEIGVYTYDKLAMIVIFNPEMVQDYLDEEAMKGLETFYEMYKSKIDENDLHRDNFRDFDINMLETVLNYLVRIKMLDGKVGLTTDVLGIPIA